VIVNNTIKLIYKGLFFKYTMYAIINTKFGLRKILKQEVLQTMTTSISEDALHPDKEPDIRTKLRLIAIELSKHPEILFSDNINLIDRKASWYTLLNKEVNIDDDIDSRSRPGHVLIDYHMPHFWSVCNWKGISVLDLARDSTIMYKALWANLRMHSTPYSSEIRRSLCMVGGLSNVTKYRAPLAKAIVKGFDAKSVLDPCAGWGGRMLGALSAGATYTGYEPCSKTVEGLKGILSDLPNDVSERCKIINQPAETGLLLNDIKYDLILTSPPYFNLESYSNEDTQSMKKYPTWEKWLTEWLDPIIIMSLNCLKEDGTSCWSVKNFKTDKKYYLADEIIEAHKRYGWMLIKVVKMTGSGRPGAGRIKNGEETRGSEEETFCFQKLNK
jgi:16S rRNA G966 N2-methylase RsmD